LAIATRLSKPEAEGVGKDGFIWVLSPWIDCAGIRVESDSLVGSDEDRSGDSPTSV